MNADSPVFEALCRGLERHTELNQLQARGVVRLLLRDAGIEPDELDKQQAAVLIDKLMPDRLLRQGIEADVVGAVCGSLQALVNAVVDAGVVYAGPNAMLRRLDNAMGQES
jgi:hypothetical protein